MDLVGGGGEGVIETPPNLRLRGFRLTAFCVVESMLYMFDTFLRTPYVYKYNLDDGVPKSNFVLEKSMVENSRARDMHSPKLIARPIPTPDGRILVHSTFIYFYSEHEDEEEDSEEEQDADDEAAKYDHFELFDPTTDTWSKLPRLQIRDAYVLELYDLQTRSWKQLPSHRSEIRGPNFCASESCFISNNTFLLHICLHLQKGFYLTLDIESPNTKGWQLYEGWIVPTVSPLPFRVIEDRLFLNTFLAYGITRRGRVSEPLCLPLSDLGPCEASRLTAIALVNYVENVECDICSIHSGWTDTESHLVVDMFNCDLSELPDAQVRVERVTSFKFLLREATKWFDVVDGFLLSSPPSPFKA